MVFDSIIAIMELYEYFGRVNNLWLRCGLFWLMVTVIFYK